MQRCAEQCGPFGACPLSGEDIWQATPRATQTTKEARDCAENPARAGQSGDGFALPHSGWVFEHCVFGRHDQLYRPCVDCGRRTGYYCDGCTAESRGLTNVVPGQHTPLCIDCEKKTSWCHFAEAGSGVNQSHGASTCESEQIVRLVCLDWTGNEITSHPSIGSECSLHW